MSDEERIYVTYAIETPLTLDIAAEAMAGEQSTGTFTTVPGQTAELLERFAARVESVVPEGSSATPSLHLARPPVTGRDRFERGEVMISFNAENSGSSLPILLSTIAGNLFELNELTGIRLRKLEVPDKVAAGYAGPQFGVNGTRALAGVHGRPLLGTIIKPSVGLSPEQTAHLVSELVDSGLDFLKDDELLGSPPSSPLGKRVARVMEVIEKAADRNGRKAMFAFNITADIDQMLRNHDAVVAAGGTCVMVSINSVGTGAFARLREHSVLPIHAHRNGWGMLTRHPMLGMDFSVYQQIWRILGADHLHVNGLQNKFWESDDSVVDSINACLTPSSDGRRVMPVVSSGQWGGQAPETFRRTRTVDLIYLAGGGIIGHPMGPRAGVAAIRQAWDAALADEALTDAAARHQELRESLRYFGGRSDSTSMALDSEGKDQD